MKKCEEKIKGRLDNFTQEVGGIRLVIKEGIKAQKDLKFWKKV